MNPTRLMTVPCVLVTVTAGAVDEYNNPTEVETDTTTTCFLHQSQRREEDGAANTQDETWQVYLPPSTTPDGWSRLEAQGMTLEFIGPPWRAFNPRLEDYTHYQATARRTR